MIKTIENTSAVATPAKLTYSEYNISSLLLPTSISQEKLSRYFVLA